MGRLYRPAPQILVTSQKILLVVLLAWALAMIAPDLWRVVQPLGSFGFYANNDGLIYDVTGPFDDQTASPAWNAGIREGDRLDLSKMRCFPYDAATCGSVLAALEGIQLAAPGRSITIELVPTPEGPARPVVLIAEERPTNFLKNAVLILDQIAGILVVLAAAWLVWTRPGGMTWGFFSLRCMVQPGPELSVLRSTATLAAAIAVAEYRRLHRSSRRLHWTASFRTARSQ